MAHWQDSIRTFSDAQNHAYAIGHDTGCSSMRKAGRKKWNDDDWNAACIAQRRAMKKFGYELPES